jgi:hypothetical protein
VQDKVSQLSLTKAVGRRLQTYVYEFLESRITPLLLFKLVLSKQLVSSICNEGLKALNLLEQDVSHARHNVGLLLTLGELFRQDSIHAEDLVSVPEYLLNKLFSFCRRNDICRAERFNPLLRTGSSDLGSVTLLQSARRARSYITQVLHIPNKIPLGIDQFVDGFLSLHLRLVDTVNDVLRHGLYPERTGLLQTGSINYQCNGERALGLTFVSSKTSSAISVFRPGSIFMFNRF